MTIDVFLADRASEAENQRLAEAQEALRQAQMTVSITLAGILQAHWPEACELKCVCGRLICYDAYYWRMVFLCNQCYAQQFPDAVK